MGMKKRGPRRWRWVTRDNNFSSVEVWPGLKKPQLSVVSYDESACWFGKGYAYLICPGDWERLFGELPPTDRPTKVEFSAKVIG